jgi:hypothetical protein
MWYFIFMTRYSVRAAQIEARELQRIITSGNASIYSQAETDLERHYISFDNIALYGLSMQSQYSSRYVEGTLGGKDLGDDIRISGNPGVNYHSLRIHEEDAPVFAARVIEHRKAINSDY